MAGSSAPGGLQKPVLLDVNGDGLTDVAYADFAALNQWELYINKGGAFGLADWLGGWVEINADNYANVQVLDYNGDGWSDLMIHEDALWKVMLSNGTGFDPKFSTGTNNVGFQSAMSTDINGDGQTDLLFYDSGWKTRYATGSFRGLLSGITDGLGANTSILYSSLAASFNDYIYEGHNANGLGGAPLVSPQISHFAAPIPLVYRVAADLGFSEGSNPQYAGTFYKYAGAKVNKWGRGFLGFEKIEAYNINTNITSVNHHRQDFPYTGMVESVWQKILVGSDDPRRRFMESDVIQWHWIRS